MGCPLGDAARTSEPSGLDTVERPTASQSGGSVPAQDRPPESARPPRRRPPLPQTRFRPPVVTKSLVERGRLIEALEAGGTARLIVIHAPAGYGKTTLASQWCEIVGQQGVAVAWLSVGSDDNSVVWFLLHVIEAIRRTHPPLADELTQVLEDHGQDAENYVLTALINAIHDDGRRFILVIDDWHRITTPTTVAALRFLLENGCHHLQVVVTSRSQSGLPLSHFRIRNELIEVTATDLRFDTGESRSLLVDLNGLDLDSDLVEQLTDTTDGWAAALQLASLSLRGRTDSEALVKTMSGRNHAIAEFLAENVLDTIEPEFLDFLLSTCLPERITGDLACALAQTPDGQSWLEQIEKRDLFLMRLDDEGEWFRYHHLFADYLRRRLRRSQPGRVRELDLIASQWFESRTLQKPAVTHALAAGDVARAVDVVQDSAMTLVEHSRMVELLGLVEMLPAEAYGDRPELLTAIAWANCLLQRPVAAQQTLDRLRDTEPAIAAGATNTVSDRADVVQACIDVFEDRTDRARDLVAPMLNLSDPNDHFYIAVAANIDSYVDIQDGRFAAAADRQRWARQFQDRNQGPFAGVYGRCFSGIAAFAELDIDIAEHHFVSALELARNFAGPQSHAAQLAGALLGELHYARNNIDDASNLLGDNGKLGAVSGVVEFMHAGYRTRARIGVLRGDQSGALEILTEGIHAADRLRLPRLKAHMIAERVHVLLSDGRAREARRAVAAMPDDQQRGDAAERISHIRAGTEALVLSAEGEHVMAIGTLTRLVEEFTQLGLPYRALQARVWLAMAHHRGHRPDQAMRAMSQALAAAAPPGLSRILLDGGPDVIEVLDNISRALRAGRWDNTLYPLPPDFLADVIATSCGAESGSGTPTLSPALHSLSAREVDVLRLVALGRSNQDIAEQLSLTVNTVKWYLKKIYTALGVANRTEAVMAGRNGGLRL